MFHVLRAFSKQKTPMQKNSKKHEERPNTSKPLGKKHQTSLETQRKRPFGGPTKTAVGPFPKRPRRPSRRGLCKTRLGTLGWVRFQKEAGWLVFGWVGGLGQTLHYLLYKIIIVQTSSLKQAVSNRNPTLGGSSFGGGQTLRQATRRAKVQSIRAQMQARSRGEAGELGR